MEKHPFLFTCGFIVPLMALQQGFSFCEDSGKAALEIEWGFIDLHGQISCNSMSRMSSAGNGEASQQKRCEAVLRLCTIIPQLNSHFVTWIKLK